MIEAPNCIFCGCPTVPTGVERAGTIEFRCVVCGKMTQKVVDAQDETASAKQSDMPCKVCGGVAHYFGVLQGMPTWKCGRCGMSMCAMDPAKMSAWQIKAVLKVLGEPPRVDDRQMDKLTDSGIRVDELGKLLNELRGSARDWFNTFRLKRQLTNITVEQLADDHDRRN